MKHNKLKSSVFGALLASTALLASHSAMAQNATTEPVIAEPDMSQSLMAPPQTEISFGVTAGVTLAPEQLVVGGTVVARNLFGPNIGVSGGGLVGLGDNLKTFRGYGHGFYEIPLQGQGMTVYPLGGLSFMHYSADCGELFGVELDCSGNELGLDIGGGVSYQNFRAEIWLGLGSLPDTTVSLSYMF